MKEHPIIFSTDMAKAILDGKKTMTRRVIKDLPNNIDLCQWKDNDFHFFSNTQPALSGAVKILHCPYGQVGDRLYCRESFKYIDFCLADIGELHPRVKVEYKVDGIQEWVNGDTSTQITIPDKWRPSIFMPRWASRITLEITEVRVERLRKATLADAIAEGFRTIAELIKAVLHLNHLTEDADPWVWVISFRRLNGSG